MNNVYVDTSAFLAVLDSDDSHHNKAKKEWAELVFSGVNLYCSNYILVETFALLQHRFGMDAVKLFDQDILPIMNILWITEPLHSRGVSAYLTASKRKLSLIDCVSFEVMRHYDVKSAFVFDAHFKNQGFECLP